MGHAAGFVDAGSSGTGGTGGNGGTSIETLPPKEDEDITANCQAFDEYGADGCVPCLSSPDGCVWVLGSCVASCDIIADAACLSPDNFPGYMDAEDICAQQPSNVTENDETLCASKNYCFTCTSTTKSDGSPCSWYIDEESGDSWCGVGGCDMNGVCGVNVEEVCRQADTDSAPVGGGDEETPESSNTDAVSQPESSASTHAFVISAMCGVFASGVLSIFF